MKCDHLCLQHTESNRRGERSVTALGECASIEWGQDCVRGGMSGSCVAARDGRRELDRQQA